ncbi:MAG: CotH kinase family protein [Planctomycetota bacterium]|jgi:hypothetical protein
MRRTILAVVATLLDVTTVRAQGLYDVSTIRTIEITAPSNWRTLMASNFQSRTPIKVDVKIDGKVYKDVGARHRGFSTYHFLPAGKRDKRPWKLLFDEYINGQRAQGYRTLNINNNVWDPSMIREVAGYEYMRRFIAAPRCCFVKLKVNNEDLGLFVNTQQINKDFLQEYYRDDEGTRYRGERASNRTSWNDTALTWLGTALSRYQAAYELKTENGKYPPWTNLISSINVLNNTPTSQLQTEIPKVIDIDNALRLIAVANVSAWLDSYLGRTCKNFYIYDDPYHGRLRFHPWDLNNGFGGLTDGLGTTGIALIPPFFRESDARYPRPLFSQLVKVPKWRAVYLAHLRTMEKELRWAKMGPRIDALRKQIRPLLQADTKRIYTMQQFDDNLTKAVNVGFVTTPGLQPFFQERNKYHSTNSEMVKKAPTLSGLVHSPLVPKATDTVWVNVTISGVAATEATLYYRVRGPFIETPMFDDGKHNDGKPADGVWGASIPSQAAFSVVDYYVGANSDLTKGGAMALLPATGSYLAPSYRVQGSFPKGPIIISEFLAKNDNGLRDSNGDRDDWIELTNIGNQAIPVSGMYLTDNVATPNKWKIPANQTLQPGSSLLIWADNEGTQGPLHASFKLSAAGEEVALFATDGRTNLDWIAFGPQQPDVSTGRLPGYLTFHVTFPLPSPSRQNQPVPCGYLAYGSPDPLAAGFNLAGQNQPKIASSVDYVIAKAPASASGGLYVGAAGSLDLPGLGALLLNPLALLPLATFQTDATGASKVSLQIPNMPALAGQTFYMQSVVSSGGWILLSNGLVTTICK